MGEQKNIVSINGKTYDSKTGVLTSSSSLRKITSSNSSGKSLEGFIRSNLAGKPSRTTKREIHQANEVHGRKQKSSTLMRSSVKKPKIPKPQSVTTRLEPEVIEKSQEERNSKNQTSRRRSEHAKNVSKSSLVTKFHISEYEPKVHKKTTEIKVKANPNEHIVRHESSIINESLTESEPVDFLSTALSHATSHEQARPKKLKRRQKVANKLGLSTRVVNIGASALLVIVLAGFIAYQNMANISMHVASAKAGISATLPGYKPAGFAINKHVQSGPGQVVVSFHSNSDSRNFNITQKTSDWNSQTLLDNFVAATDQPYQQIDQNNGKTVFIYGISNATWVDSGIWYKIEGNSSLSNSQLLSLANSF